MADVYVLQLMEEHLVQTVVKVEKAAAYQACTAEDGRTYYHNSSTNETTWDRPAEMKSLASTLVETAKIVTEHEDSIVAVDETVARGLVSAISQHASDPECSTPLAATLNAITKDDMNSLKIVENGGLQAIVHAIYANPHNKDVLRMLIAVLEIFSHRDQFKELIGQSGAIKVIVDIGLMMHTDDNELVKLCLSTLANLAFNSEANIDRIVADSGVDGAEKAMQVYPDDPRLLENAMCMLSNLMFASDENKLTIGQTTGDEIVHVIRVHYKDANLVKMALRALGNLSYCDENIRYVVEEGATGVIVHAMRQNPGDEELIRLSMEVIGNFTSLEEDKAALPEDKEPVSFIVYREGGSKTIIQEMLDRKQNSAVLKAGMDALSNLANDDEVTELMAKEQGVVQLVVDVMKSHDWDEELVEHSLPVLTILTYVPECINALMEADGLGVIVSAMETHSEQEELLISGQCSLTNIASVPETRRMMVEQSILEAILGFMEMHRSSVPYLMECFNTLLRLSADEAISRDVASKGMHVLFSIVKSGTSSPDVLCCIFQLIGQLAFVPDNLKEVVQHQGIAQIMKCITKHPEHKDLILSGIQTLDNIAMASKEYCQIVIKEGGKRLIERILKVYTDDSDIQRHGRSALLQMSALESLAVTEKLMEKTGGGGATSAPKRNARLRLMTTEGDRVDPLRMHRSLLKAGAQLTIWLGKSKQASHFSVSGDWTRIEYSYKGKSGGARISALKSVVEGNQHFAKKRLGKNVAEDVAFSILLKTGEDPINVEVSSASERTRWVRALRALIDTYKATPELVKK